MLLSHGARVRFLVCTVLAASPVGAHAQVSTPVPAVVSDPHLVPGRLALASVSRSVLHRSPAALPGLERAGATITGVDVPEMADYDAFLSSLFEEYGVPGAAVGVVKDGRLIYARGFGVADTLTGEPVQPDARFRIASVSKPITAVSVLRLVEDGLLGLDDPAFAYLPDLPPPPGQADDPRLATVTIRDLLQHSAGWDRVATGFDPVMHSVAIANLMGVPAPADTETIIRFMRGRALDFTPGTRFAYSNLGYAVLGAIIERVTRQPYEAYARSVLSQAGVSSMELGRSLLENRLPGEARYHSFDGLSAPSVFPPHATVPLPYGGYHMEAFDAFGAWVGSTVDLLRFLTAVDGRTPRPDILTAASIQAMTARPAVPTWATTPYWVGLGWFVDTSGTWWHDGELDGATAFLLRKESEGLAWVVLCNTRRDDDYAFFTALDFGLWDLASLPRTWPTHDLFGPFTGPEATPGAPVAFDLSAASPNPVADVTTLWLTISEAQPVRVDVVDALGRSAELLHDGSLAAGRHALRFEARARPSGLYLVRAVGARGSAIRRMTLLR